SLDFSATSSRTAAGEHRTLPALESSAEAFADSLNATSGELTYGGSDNGDAVNVPQSRVKSFFGNARDKFTGKKKENLSSSPSDWLGVDEDYDARKEGRAIGSWDNFSEDEPNEDEWKGGAYGGHSREENEDAMFALSNGLLDKEVWLVAVGANGAKEDGIKTLLDAYDNELRNAMFINVLGVGRGDLCVTAAEGSVRSMGTDQRLQNTLSSSAQTRGIPLGRIAFKAFDTDAVPLLRAGARAVSLIGMAKGLPAGWRWFDDKLELIREDNLQTAAEVLVETIKSC
ncbi:MAG: hypothetical protein LBR39_05980, partial [Coriobacteriales bacterium]|nr:hypothetical protein [Coriobacteriales bacterium]